MYSVLGEPEFCIVLYSFVLNCETYTRTNKEFDLIAMLQFSIGSPWATPHVFDRLWIPGCCDFQFPWHEPLPRPHLRYEKMTAALETGG